mmetsp:Transcript_38234/g.75271  ORF Transcript_38234/g.75271 Transcript_38234/m.75271 type:complete len:134 (+) Transcript_38234:32-433(+)
MLRTLLFWAAVVSYVAGCDDRLHALECLAKAKECDLDAGFPYHGIKKEEDVVMDDFNLEKQCQCYKSLVLCLRPMRCYAPEKFHKGFCEQQKVFNFTCPSGGDTELLPCSGVSFLAPSLLSPVLVLFAYLRLF